MSPFVFLLPIVALAVALVWLVARARRLRVGASDARDVSRHLRERGDAFTSTLDDLVAVLRTETLAPAPPGSDANQKDALPAIDGDRRKDVRRRQTRGRRVDQEPAPPSTP